MNHPQFREVLKQRVVKAYTSGILGDLKHALIDESQKLLDLFDRLPDVAAEIDKFCDEKIRELEKDNTNTITEQCAFIDVKDKLKELSDGK